MPEEEQQPMYKMASKAVDDWLKLHEGETFDLDTICRQLEIHDAAKRNLITIKLAYEVKRGNLEKHNRIYTIVNKNINIIPWYDTSTSNTLAIKWPCSHLDSSEFDFENHIVVSEGNLIVIAGVSNMGKSCFAQNLLYENMDSYPSQLMVNEYNPGTFKRRISKMDWTTPFREDGKPKFQMIERHADWKYAIQPDWINIIDWMNLADGDFWKVGSIMEDIQSKLRKGIAVIVLQKNEAKDLGTGGQYSEHLASVYFTLDFNRLNVRKVKEHDGFNPNGKTYGFEIIDGVHFTNIRQLKPCPKCHSRCLVNKVECIDCHSTGYVDKLSN